MLPIHDEHRQDVLRVGRIAEVPLILEACRTMTGMGFIAVARVTEDRWITCAALDDIGFGLAPGDELDVTTTICREVRACGEQIVIPDVAADPVFRDHPVPQLYNFRSYIATPIIRADGSFWGTLCAIDPDARPLPDGVRNGFQLFAKLVAAGLDRLDELDDGRAALVIERDTARLREEFIAVVGHDLRNPIAAVSAGLSLLGRDPDEETRDYVMTEMQRALGRAAQIITNLLDFARGRLGAGIDIVAPRPVDLAPHLNGVIREIAGVATQPIETVIDLPVPIRADPQRLCQLLSNLLANAVSHGRADAPIRVEVLDRDGVLTLSVTNQGPAIPPEVIASLFAPFSRGASGTGQGGGLGLGLYIASQIAQAHGGRIDVSSSDEGGTVFCAKLPARYD